MSAGTQVSNQERRAAVVPQLSRWSTIGQSLVLFLHRFTWDFACSCLQRLAEERGLSSIVWWVQGTVASWANRPIGVLCCPAPPRPAVPPCAAPSRPARVMSGFWVRQVPPMVYMGFLLFVLSNTRPGQLSSYPWKARRLVFSWANKPADGVTRPAPPCPAPPALPRPVPSRTACGMSGFWVRKVHKGCLPSVRWVAKKSIVC